jgi:hypothetical protein
MIHACRVIIEGREGSDGFITIGDSFIGGGHLISVSLLYCAVDLSLEYLESCRSVELK